MTLIPDEFSRLLQTLNNSRVQTENQALYQTIAGLIRAVEALKAPINSNIPVLIASTVSPANTVTTLDGITNDPGSSTLYSRGDHKHDFTTTGVVAGTYGDASNVPQITVDAVGRVTNLANIPISAAVDDYVVMSDGATPTPSPVDDGFGNFIYIAYTP